MQFLRTLRQFLPIDLLFLQLRINLFSILYWLFLIAIVCDSIGKAFGLSYLFLSPEYNGQTGNFAFFLIGFSIGGFTMAYHSYLYIRLAPRYPFLATLSRPFVRFVMNNSILPVFFLIIYAYKMSVFQLHEELRTPFTILNFNFCFFGGFAVFNVLAFSYFFPLNKNVKDVLKKRGFDRSKRYGGWQKVRTKIKSKQSYFFYCSKFYQIKKSRSVAHYSEQTIQAVFKQNRISTSIFELLTVSSFLVFGFLGARFDIIVPAGMSIILLLTILLMVFNFLFAWFKSYTVLVLIGSFVLIQFISKNTTLFLFQTKVNSMSYNHLQPYSIDQFKLYSLNRIKMKQDSLAWIRTFEKWKVKTGKLKPKLVVINVSGGGTRSASWVYRVLRNLEKNGENRLMKHTFFMSGASGGMLGASFYRSDYYQRIILKKRTQSRTELEKAIESDLLNALSFTACTNDLFVRYGMENEHGEAVSFNRAFSFEKQLNSNTFSMLNQRMKFFSNAEKKADIPLLVFNPTVINDGRQLIFSGLPMHFLFTKNGLPGTQNAFPQLDASTVLGTSQIQQMRLSELIRINATFPFVMPMTSLPTSPRVELMDAGVTDNFGGTISLRLLAYFKDWIKKNTSGVVVVQIRDTEKLLGSSTIRSVHFLDRLFAPMDNVFSNFPQNQDYTQDLLYEAFGNAVPISSVSFNLRDELTDRISLSWHLTNKERGKVSKAIRSKANLSAKKKISNLLKS